MSMRVGVDNDRATVRAGHEADAPALLALIAAHAEGFDRLCAFARAARLVARLGFSIVPQTWVPEKLAQDCANSQHTFAAPARPHAY